MSTEIERAHAALVDAAAESDDALLEKYLEGTELTDDEVRTALHAATARGSLVPIICSAAAGRSRAPRWCSTASSGTCPARTERTRRARPQGQRDRSSPATRTASSVAHVFKTTVDTFGKVSFFKVLRGTMRGDTHPLNARLGQEERFAQLGQPNGKAIVTVTEVVAGDIGVVTKLAHTHTGDTLCAKDAPVTLPPLPSPAATRIGGDRRARARATRTRS